MGDSDFAREKKQPGVMSSSKISNEVNLVMFFILPVMVSIIRSPGILFLFNHRGKIRVDLFIPILLPHHKPAILLPSRPV
jgi:hypothetical protein